MVDIEIDKVCRVCLQSHLELSLLFDEQNAIDGVYLSDMISECTMYTVRRHDEFPHLICTECIERVQNAYRFKKQYETSHRKLITFLDSVNKDSVDIKPNVNEKSIQTDEIAIYPCEKCDEKFINYDKLKVHRTLAHKGTANHCRKCLKTFRSIGSLKNHIAVRHPEEGHTAEHVCSVCDKKFTRKNHVLRHMRAIHKMAIVGENEVQVDNEEEDESADEIKTEVVDNETLNETEIDYGIIKQEAEVILSPKYEASFDEDNMSNGVDFADTNPFSSDEDDQPLSSLKSVEKENSNASTAIAAKVEPSDSNKIINLNEPNITTESYQMVDDNKYKCTVCQKTFSRKSHVRRHLLSHKEDKPYACTVCDKRFGRADHLKVHVIKHHDEKPFPCDECDRKFSTSSLLKRHKLFKHDKNSVEKSEVCRICNKLFCNKNYLQKHMRLHTERGWKCKMCPAQFETKESLKEHAKSHHRERPYLCSECGLRFLRNDYLLVHMRRHNGEKPFKCKYCDKRFPRTTDLNVHERYHTGEKTHLCTICGKGFQRAYNLVVHMRVHTGERPYQCPSCPKNFAQCNDLKAHVRRHTGERYKCEICGAGFIQGYHLTQHKHTVHGIEMESRTGRVTKVSSNGVNEKVLPKDIVHKDKTAEDFNLEHSLIVK